MTTFDKREEGFEKKFALDEELRFKANARRNKLVGLWAAEKLGLAGADAESYAKEVVMAAFDESGGSASPASAATAAMMSSWRFLASIFPTKRTTKSSGPNP